MATREIVGWSIAAHLRAELVGDALLLAIQSRKPARGSIHTPIEDRRSDSSARRSLTVAGLAAGCGTRGAKAVLGGDCGRGVERRCCSFGRRPPGGRRAM